jgi:acyl carrier protein
VSDLSVETTRIDLILGIVRSVLDRPGIGPDDEVMDHGGTSLSLVRILTETGRALQVNINPRDLDGIVTARSLANAAR